MPKCERCGATHRTFRAGGPYPLRVAISTGRAENGELVCGKCMNDETIEKLRKEIEDAAIIEKTSRLARAARGASRRKKQPATGS